MPPNEGAIAGWQQVAARLHAVAFYKDLARFGRLYSFDARANETMLLFDLG
jgi:hypothetical protein